VFVTFFGGLELLLRAFWTPPVRQPVVGDRKFLSWLSDIATTDPLGGPLYQTDPELLWSLVPGAEVTTTISHRHPKGEQQPVRITINEDGYRGRRFGENANDSKDTLSVLCLGDSNFFGYPLDDAHAFPSVLGQKLGKLLPDRDIEVINAGVPGFTIVQGERLYEQLFRDREFDVVLLSYLNNDAWPQPQTDTQLLASRDSVFFDIARISSRSRVVAFLGSMVATEVDPKNFVARVPLEEFLQRYRSMITTLRARDSRVVIVDHCAHQEYDPFSSALRSLAEAEGVEYFGVARRVGEQLQNLADLDRYGILNTRVMRRWGIELLLDRPHLRLYAEYKRPEHLNEVGVAWLADAIAPTLFERDK
jgi:lysophospholipase L1-like esterase